MATSLDPHTPPRLLVSISQPIREFEARLGRRASHPPIYALIPHSFLSCEIPPLNLFLSQRPAPSTRCGSEPCTPSVYCQNVQRANVGGTLSGFGPLY